MLLRLSASASIDVRICGHLRLRSNGLVGGPHMPRRAALIAAVIAFAGTLGATDAHAAGIPVAGVRDTLKASIVDYSPSNGRFSPIRSVVAPTGFTAEKANGGGDDSGVVCGAPFINGDPRLGPKRLPTTGVLGEIVRNYVPLGGVLPAR